MPSRGSTRRPPRRTARSWPGSIDAWEHAYYLQYHDQKTAFFEAVWRLWNWNDISARYAKARRLDLALADRR
jgi:iron/manganese superoxide dismutase-like protein